jgi:hypothetical protein
LDMPQLDCGVGFFAALQQRVASEGDDYAHVDPASALTMTALMVCSRFSA